MTKEYFDLMLLITYQTLKEEKSIQTCSSRDLGSTKLGGSFGYVCDI